MKARRKGNVLRVSVPEAEAALLGGLFDEFATLLESPDPADPVIQRLYPDGYADDTEASAEYRDLVEEGLRQERQARLLACRAEVAEGAGRFELDDEATDRWLRVLNDLRLTLGTRLGVTEDEEMDDSIEAVNVYHWLTAVQDLLISNVMG